MTELLAGSSFRRDRARVADQVTEDLRAQILSGRLARGMRLPSEKELAAHYEVSSPTVREALRALSAMSLVEVRHGSGTFVIAETGRLLSSAMASVVQMERVDIQDILDVSEAIYVKAVRRGVRDASTAELKVLRSLADRFAAADGDINYAGVLADFLKAMVATSHNALMIGLSGFLIDRQVALAQDASRRSPELWERIAGELIAERNAIVAALETRNADAAEAAVVAYTGRARDLIQRNLPDTPRPDGSPLFSGA